MELFAQNIREPFRYTFQAHTSLIHIEYQKDFIIIINSYVPCTGHERIEYFKTMKPFIQRVSKHQVIWGGDLNCVELPSLDSSVPTRIKDQGVSQL